MTWLLLAVVAAVLLAGLFLRGRLYKPPQSADENFPAGAEVVDDTDLHKAINDLLKEAGERGASEVQIGISEPESAAPAFSAKLLRGSEIVHEVPLRMEWRENTARRIKIMAGLDPWPNEERLEGLLRFRVIGRDLQEFKVTFEPEDSGGTIILKVT